MRVNVAIASPGDVADERQAVLKVFTAWNDKNDQAFLHPVMWEFAGVPTMGAHPQEILNQQIIERSDLLIAVLWSKLGTPTANAASGTVEEVREFIAKKGAARVMLYFCQRPIPVDTDPDALRQLNYFKSEMRPKGLFHEYSSLQDFENSLYQHLDRKIDDFICGRLRPPAPTAAIKKPENRLPSDPRLHELIDYGKDLPRIIQGFTQKMEEFHNIDGIHPNKFYAYGAHVYTSVASCIDRYLTSVARTLAEEDYFVLQRLSTRLKRLADEPRDPKAPFPDFWIAGRDIASDLAAHVTHMKRLKRL